MAIRKPGSRFSDRNKMRQMEAEGFARAQIAEKLSIVDSHVDYCLDHWSTDMEKIKDQQKAAAEKALAAERARNRAPVQQDTTALKAELRAEILAEQAAEATAKQGAGANVVPTTQAEAEPAGETENQPDGEAETEDKAEVKKVEKKEAPKRAKRRKRAA